MGHDAPPAGPGCPQDGGRQSQEVPDPGRVGGEVLQAARHRLGCVRRCRRWFETSPHRWMPGSLGESLPACCRGQASFVLMDHGEIPRMERSTTQEKPPRLLIHRCGCDRCEAMQVQLDALKERLRQAEDARLSETLHRQEIARRRRASGEDTDTFDQWSACLALLIDKMLREAQCFTIEERQQGLASAQELNLAAARRASDLWVRFRSQDSIVVQMCRAQSREQIAYTLDQTFPGHSLSAALLADDPMSLLDI